MNRRQQHVPWKAAGSASEQQASADDVVRRTGWVFNNRTGDELDLAEFVRTGDHETLAYLQAFGLAGEHNAGQTLLEIGSGIGRMTASFTRMFATVVACDLDAAFLERCRETVAQFGRPDHLRTVHVFDGRTLRVSDGSIDLGFSYITLQHCHHDDALALTHETIRAVRPGGQLALNYRTWSVGDVVLWPTGKIVRGLWRVPGIGPVLATQRWATRLGWQANRLSPTQVLGQVQHLLDDVRLVRSPKRKPFRVEGVAESTFEGVNPSHWWLIATVR
jgi:SAM-dependent methyltransferase